MGASIGSSRVIAKISQDYARVFYSKIERHLGEEEVNHFILFLTGNNVMKFVVTQPKKNRKYIVLVGPSTDVAPRPVTPSRSNILAEQRTVDSLPVSLKC